jgi:nucleotide-binding universal stress UspA family protein
MLIMVVVEPPIPAPHNEDRTAMRERAATTLRGLSVFMAPGARGLVETDRSVVRAFERVSRRERPDLLVVGSSSGAPEGRVRIGRHIRQLLGHTACSLGVAPRNLCAAGMPSLATIGVAYDGTPEAREALRLAGSLAGAAGARLRVRALPDDRLPWLGWSPVLRAERQASRGGAQEIWEELIEPQVESLRDETERARQQRAARPS